MYFSFEEWILDCYGGSDLAIPQLRSPKGDIKWSVPEGSVPDGYIRNNICGQARKVLPSVDELNEILRYCPETGFLFWNKNIGRKIKTGARAGTLTPAGYRHVAINGTIHPEHQISMIVGHQRPLKLVDTDGYALVVDHINGITDDNRLWNLEEITVSENLNKQVRKTLKTAKDGTELLTGINRAGRKYSVCISIRSFWRSNSPCTKGGTQLAFVFENYDDAVVFKLFTTRFKHGDIVVKNLEFNFQDSSIIHGLYSGTVAKTGHTIKEFSIKPEVMHIYNDEFNYYHNI